MPKIKFYGEDKQASKALEMFVISQTVVNYKISWRSMIS